MGFYGNVFRKLYSCFIVKKNQDSTTLTEFTADDNENKITFQGGGDINLEVNNKVVTIDGTSLKKKINEVNSNLAKAEENLKITIDTDPQDDTEDGDGNLTYIIKQGSEPIGEINVNIAQVLQDVDLIKNEETQQYEIQLKFQTVDKGLVTYSVALDNLIKINTSGDNFITLNSELDDKNDSVNISAKLNIEVDGNTLYIGQKEA